MIVVDDIIVFTWRHEKSFLLWEDKTMSVSRAVSGAKAKPSFHLEINQLLLLQVYFAYLLSLAQ
jgi:hypothetical protein